MVTVRPSGERGQADLGWLQTRHTFSFGEYDDPAHMGFRALRVINEDVVAPARGFGSHPHRDMEILTYMLDGELAHQDSMGHGSVIKRGRVQRMTAGIGVVHSEMNPSENQPAHLLQIWIEPDTLSLEPGYEETTVSSEPGRWQLIAAPAPAGAGAAVRIHQDARVSAATLEPGSPLAYDLTPGRHAWIHVVRGPVDLNGVSLEAGDGAAVSEEGHLELTAPSPAEVLLFDLA